MYFWKQRASSLIRIDALLPTHVLREPAAVTHYICATAHPIPTRTRKEYTMSTNTSETNQATAKMPKMMMPRVLGLKRIFLTLFIGLLVFNFLIVVAGLTYGWTEGYNGVPGFDWERLTAVLAGMFGSFGNFLMILGALAILWLVLQGSTKLAQSNHKAAGWLVVVALLLGVVATSLGWIRLDTLNIGFVPFLIFVIGTGIEAAIFTAVLATTFRWKRTNH